MEDFTLFNWGRDYLAYQNQKHTLNREEQILQEQKRGLKFAVIAQYFRLVKIKEILNVKREQLRQASFIHKVAREKLKLRKIRAQEYYQTRSEYLRAQTEYQESSFELGVEEEKMANLLGDEYRGAYRTAEQLRYVALNASEDEALKLSLAQSPAFRNAKLIYDNASRSYEKTLKDNLPLPKFSLNLGTYRTGFDPDGSYWNYQTSPGNRNVELVAAIDMRWNLIGEGGFFNGRRNQEAFLNKRIAETNFYNTKREVEVKIRTIYKTLRFLEQKVDISSYQQKNAQSNYDVVLDNYVSGVATYPDIKLALDNLVISLINTQEVKFNHLLRKLELADLMGLEDFPGENFEALAVK
jgi:outer membrane protein TolC